MENSEHLCRVLVEGGSGEIVEKKSRFIATLRKTETEEEAAAFIEEMKKKYWDARHNCSALILGSKEQLTRCSDDGEPAGTAGRPMLEFLMNENLCDVTAVVTRYFGGTLLGTGGLVRAYTAAVREGLAHCRTGILRVGLLMEVETDYNGAGKIQYLAGQKAYKIVKTDYTEKVRMVIRVPETQQKFFTEEVTGLTSGKAGIRVLEKTGYIDKENPVK